MKQQQTKTVGLLIEIILSAAFFPIISAVILQIFMQTQTVGKDSRDKASAMALTQSIADMYISRQDFDSMLEVQYENALLIEKDNRYTINLDDDINPSEKEAGDCFVSIDLSEVKKTSAGTLSRAKIQVEKQGDVLFELSVDKYRPGDKI